MASRRRPARSRKPPRREATRGPLVLIVEDHGDTQYIYAAYFSAHGFRVQTGSDGETAVRRAIESKPDVIVMDLALPQLDGWEATRRIKKDPRTAHIPIVACTAHVLGTPVERALEAGCDSFLAKPCLPEDLLREVQRLLARAALRLRRA
jgi:CheY-like chemotaxis protein